MKLYQKLRAKREDKKGFTLVELIVVIVILAILAAILVPALLGYIDRARESQYVLDAKSVYMSMQSIASEKYATATSYEALSATSFTNDVTEIENTASVTDLVIHSVTPASNGQATPSNHDYYTIKSLVVTFTPSTGTTTVTMRLENNTWTVGVWRDNAFAET